MGIIEAAIAIAAGQCDYAALMYANIGRSRRVNYGGDESPGTWDPWGFTSPGAAHAMAFRRHMETVWHHHAATGGGFGLDPVSRVPEPRCGDAQSDHHRGS